MVMVPNDNGLSPGTLDTAFHISATREAIILMVIFQKFICMIGIWKPQNVKKKKN